MTISAFQLIDHSCRLVSWLYMERFLACRTFLATASSKILCCKIHPQLSILIRLMTQIILDEGSSRMVSILALVSFMVMPVAEVIIIVNL